MPIITALEDAGLSPDPTAAAADSYVPAGQQLAVDWIRPSDDGALALVSLAGPYTFPGAGRPLAKGTIRYLNPARFEIPADAWQGGARRPAEAPQAEPVTKGLLPPEVAALTHHYEGCRLEAYPDPKTNGKPITIGWGSTFYEDHREIRLGDRITQEQADALYEFNCYHRFWKKLEAGIPFWEEMNDRQRAALCSFAYNLGADFYGGVNFDTISACLRDRRWEAVPGALMLYRNPRDAHVVVGLGRRRRAEGLVWMGADPNEAIRQAEREISSAEDARRWEETLRAAPPSPGGASARAIAEPTSSGELKLQDVIARNLVIDHGDIPSHPALAT
jgi:GH24 family phage-related lysozyme (muramidase)